MVRKKITQHLKQTILLLVMLIFAGFAQGADLISFNLISNYNSTSGFSSGTMSTTASSPTFASSSYLQTNGWDAATAGGFKSYETSSFSTFGYYNVVVNASIYSQTTGPRDFAVEYKIGSEGTWTQAGTFTVGSTGANKQVTLPSACKNQTSVFVRWIATSYTSVSNGTVTSAFARNYIYGVSISGDLPTVPENQATTIRFVSITPTTIRVSCTPGNGDNRIIVMQTDTTHGFILPTDDYDPIANPIYAGGEQVVYKGTGSIVTVTVPSSTNEYFFRVFDFKINDGMTRYITSRASDNPKLCALATITTDPATNVRLTRATLGATISKKKSTIIDRGMVWSLTSGDEFSNNNEFSEYDTQEGFFSLNFPDDLYGTNSIPRGQTIYFKGYVENISGKIYSAESSFTNVPTFTGTGNWEDNTKWNVLEVPGANGDATYGSIDDSPVIHGNCTLNSSNSVTNLTIDSSYKLSINTATTLNIDGTATNNNSVNGLLIKSGSGVANGSIIFANPGANSSVPASVQMYSKSYWDTQYHWQYFGIPVQSTTVGTTFTTSGNRVRQYNESNIDPTNSDIGLWLPSGIGNTMTSSESLVPVVGYEVVKPSASTYTFKGNLNTSDFSNYSLGYTSGADWQGDNIITNPFAGAINIASITSSNTDGAVYLYNSGSREEWESNSGSSIDGESPGQYIASNGAYAGSLGTPNQIPSMQGFLVKATASGATITLPYSSVITNEKPQRVKQLAAAEIIGSRIDVTGTKYADKMWIFTSDNCSKNFDQGYDAVKLLGSASTPQIYATEVAGDYQIDAVNDMNNTTLSFMPGSETNLKLKFTHQNIELKYSKVYLVDLEENKTIDITESGSEYSFTSTSTSTPSVRFKIITTPSSVTSENSLNDNSKLNIFSTSNNILIQNATDKSGQVYIYNMSGLLIRTNKIQSNELTTISNLTSGAYIVKATIDNDKYIERLIIR
ncbi:MAG: T9SS type A sorting domain-containing protein [Paludibacter sp.]|nr:T9SS type A sorting domain-containing protein [Paludibacter sp.]